MQGQAMAAALARRLPLAPAVLVAQALLSPHAALASGGLGGASLPAIPLSRSALLSRLALWLVLFTTAALLAGAETAITTLWPWKVKQLAAEEKERDIGGPFGALESDITRVLGTVLIGVTFCTIFGTALATDVAVGFFGKAGITYATVAITVGPRPSAVLLIALSWLTCHELCGCLRHSSGTLASSRTPTDPPAHSRMHLCRIPRW